VLSKRTGQKKVKIAQTIDLLGFDVYLPNSNHSRICHVDKLTLPHKEKTLGGLRIGQFAYEAEEVYYKPKVLARLALSAILSEGCQDDQGFHTGFVYL